MNEFLLFDVGNQKHAEAVRRAERHAAVPNVTRHVNEVRGRIASALIVIASHLQPDLRCELSQPIQPATA